MSKLIPALISLFFLSFISRNTFSTPISSTRNDEINNLTYGHPSLDISLDNSHESSIGPAMEIFGKFIRKPFPYGFTEFLRGGTALFHHQQLFPARIISHLRGFINGLIVRAT